MTPSEGRDEQEDDAFIGRVVAGNFRIDRLIGSGATGNVYQAEQLSLGKGVAVKILHPHLVGDEKLVKRFQREAKSASRLNHANSVQIIESGQDGTGVLFIAMELLSGRDLAEVIRDEFPLPVPRIIHIMSQVFSALDEAHAHGVIHRDLKPSNVMLIERRNQTDFVKVCDYGIAKAPAEEATADGDSQMLTVQGLVCGTPEYMSPEQARGEVLDGRTDLYSAAVILYQMVTGDVPFRAATPIGIVSRHLSEVPALPSAVRGDSGVPGPLDELIMRGLAKSRDLRPATAAIFREELEQLGSASIDRRMLANAPTLTATDARTGDQATTANLSAHPSRDGASGRSLKMIGLGLLTAAVLGLGGVTLLRQGARSPEATTPNGPTPGNVAAAPTGAPVAAPPPPSAGPAPSGEIAGENPERRVAEAAGTAEAPAEPSRAEGEPPAVTGDSGSKHRTPGARNGTLVSSRTTGPARPTPKAATGVGKSTPKVSGEGAPANPVAASPREVPAPAAESARGNSDDKVASAARAPREVVAEAEKLLAQGEVGDACRRGEEVKKTSARLAAVYKFLGKCYMRAGKPALAKDNYRRYLELEPNAPDAVFIESIVK